MAMATVYGNGNGQLGYEDKTVKEVITALPLDSIVMTVIYDGNDAEGSRSITGWVLFG